ncbi:MAG: zinc metallopeptidase [Clostridia bacterium]|nr:zinc metallopeptidase [Clostridia bacterium]
MLILLPAILLTIYAQAKVTSTYKKYSKVHASSGLNAAEAARRLLDSSGLNNVRIEQVRGNLTDHYDPRGKVLRLSESTYGSSSVAALGVAAHEAGHAMQDAESYGPLKFRGFLAPVAQFGSSAAWVLIILGLALSAFNLIGIGIICFGAVVLFQVVTLPVELNASNRALLALESGGFLGGEEIAQTNKVLRAAALTYIAAALVSILQLLRLLMIFSGRRH